VEPPGRRPDHAASAADAARRSRLMAIKLAALVRDHLRLPDDGGPVGTPAVFAAGAALLRDGEAWVLAGERGERSLGPALAWSHQQGATSLHLLAEDSTGVLARRAAMFTDAPAVWHVEGRALLPAIATPYEPSPDVPVAHLALRTLIEDAGAVALIEHGVLVGEVAGLEVCRVVTDPLSGEPRLEVGVGAHDREAFQLIHGNVPPGEALRDVVRYVADQRLPGAEPHPLNRLAAERLLRDRVQREPRRVSAAHLAPADPPLPRPNVKDPMPCVSVGSDPQGRTVAVVCSTGVDLDLVPFAADARAAIVSRARSAANGGDGREPVRLILAVPSRDVVPVTRRLAAALREPAEIVGLEPSELAAPGTST
jgi:hypothetical protein